jgi:hypothetical protein
MGKIVICITCDVEVQSKKNIEEIKDILALTNRYNIEGTFFIQTTHDNIDLYLDSKIVSNFKNHELGLHIHWGNEESYIKGLENISMEVMQRELEACLEFSKELGFTPISFRGGGLCCTNTSLKLIKDYGFKIDSSVATKLNEREGWFQGHMNVPYRSWYYPSKQSYDIPASSLEDRIGILEVPVTRMVPSGRGWFPWTLTPESPFFKFIVYEGIIKSRWEPATVITPIFHSWGEGRLRAEKDRFSLFMGKLENSIKFMVSKNFEFMRMRDFYRLLESNRSNNNL